MFKNSKTNSYHLCCSVKPAYYCNTLSRNHENKIIIGQRPGIKSLDSAIHRIVIFATVVKMHEKL